MARTPETTLKRAFMNTIGFLKWVELSADDVYELGLSGAAGIGIDRVFLSPDVNSLHICWTDRDNWIMHEIADYPYPSEPVTIAEFLEDEIGGDSWDCHEPHEMTIWEALSDYGNEFSADNPPPTVTLAQLKTVEDDLNGARELLAFVANLGTHAKKSGNRPSPLVAWLRAFDWGC